MHDFACIPNLPPNCSLPATLGIDFNDTTQPANFEIVSSLGRCSFLGKSLTKLIFVFCRKFFCLYKIKHRRIAATNQNANQHVYCKTVQTVRYE